MTEHHTPTYGRAGAVNARDFSTSTADHWRDSWTPGKMRHLIAALEGRTVAYVTKGSTGHAVVGRLERVFDGGAARGNRVLVVTEHNRTNYYLPEAGPTVMVLDDTMSGVKWTALRTYAQEQAAAIAYCRRGMDEDWTGKWVATPGQASVTVTRQGKDYGDHTVWNVALSDLEPTAAATA